MFHSNYYLSLSKLLHSPMTQIYLFESIFMFVKTLVGVFIPLYLYSQGIDLITIFLFMGFVSFVKVLFDPLAISILNKVGFKWTLTISIPVYILFLYSINDISNSLIELTTSLLLLSLHMALFWPAMHAEVAQRSLGNSSKIGNLQLIITIVTAFAPAVGGFLLEFSSYQILLTLSFILLVLASIPLLLTKDIALKKVQFNYATIVKYLKLKKNRCNIPFYGEGIEGILVLVVAPLLFFIWMNSNFATVGFIFTLVSYLTIVFVFIFKKIVVKYPKRKSLKRVSQVTSISWIFRAVAFSLGGVILIISEVLDKMLGKAFYITYLSVLFDVEEKDKLFEYIMQREVAIGIVKGIVGMAIALALYIFDYSLYVLIISLLIGIIASLMKGLLADLTR
ncbi:MAG: hypothetical protein LAT82_03035 [Nanoarchaeota archaeon]|nr:hypothetical protein [Nanoarchaeota archaeon]